MIVVAKWANFVQFMRWLAALVYDFTTYLSFYGIMGAVYDKFHATYI